MNPNESLLTITAEKVTPESPLSEMHDIIDKIDSHSIEDTTWLVSLNHDYATIVEGLSGNSTATKIKILDKLLTSQIIDTKQNLWGELSQSLRKCFVSSSNEIFTRSLKIHHRIISFPNTSCDGYLNLLRSTLLLLNSRYFNDLNKSRIWQALQLILEALNVVIKFLLHASHSVIDDVTNAFISVLTFKSVFEFFGTLHPDATYLRHFCYGAYIRNAFFNNLKEKNVEFVKHVAAAFSKDGALPYGHFLFYFLQFRNNLNFFASEIGLDSVEAMVTRMNQRRNPKLVHLVTDLFTINPYILTPNLLDLLIEPLSGINRGNIRNSLENHRHIFTVITNVAKSPNFRVLFGTCGSVRRGRSRQISRNCTNLPQRITDLAIIVVRMSTTHDEVRPEDAKILPILLNCVASIYHSHPVSLTHVNPIKLIQNLRDFYRLSWKNDGNLRDPILGLFEFFYAWYPPILRVLGANNEILLDLMSFTKSRTFVNRIGCDKSGFEFLKSHRNQIVRPYLEKIWLCEDLDGTDDLDAFLAFLFVVKMSARSVVAFLADDDDDSTVVESGNKSLALVDVIEKSLNESGEDDEHFLGILIMKVLIANLDLLLYLQANHHVQDKLKFDEENTIIDAQTSLRNDILVYLDTIGLAQGSLETHKDNDFREFLQRESSDPNWLTQARRVFKNCTDIFDPSLVPVLLDRVPKTFVYRKTDLHWPPPDCVYYQLHPEDFCGISLVISFGEKTGLLNKNINNTLSENLSLLVKQSRAYLGHQPENFLGFDWFLGVIFLISGGNLGQCKSLLINFTNTQVTALLWATFGKEFDHNLQENFYQALVVVLEENCPCFEALKMLGIAPDLMVQSWLNQCFFNCLRFEEICNFLIYAVLHPVQSVLYYMVAIFEHLNDRICTVTHSPQLNNLSKMSDLSDFRLRNYVPLIESLTKKYRNSHKL